MYIIPAHILKLCLRTHVEPIRPTHANSQLEMIYCGDEIRSATGEVVGKLICGSIGSPSLKTQLRHHKSSDGSLLSECVTQ